MSPKSLVEKRAVLFTPEDIARVCHEVNRELTAHAGDVPVQKPWAESTPEMQASTIDGVKFHLANPNASPEEAHENWVKHRTANGWTHNGIYDEANKRHPHLRPYGALPPEVRLKDKVFRAIIRAMV